LTATPTAVDKFPSNLTRSISD